MPGRRGWLPGAAGILILGLFAGRYAAEILADRWWAAQFSPEAAAMVTRWHLAQLALGAFGAAFAIAWFVLQMLVVLRAVGSVQILRDVGGVQFREVVRPTLLRVVAVGAGLGLGLITGLSLAGAWQAVMLAGHGVTSAMVDPLLGRGAGWYLARLPLLRLLHDFALALALLAVLAVLMFYAIMGAVRLERRRPAINDHAQRHLGLLLAVLALVLAWGFLLKTGILVGEGGGEGAAIAFRRAVMTNPALAGTAFMVAAVSALWAFQGRHALLAAAWLVLGVATVVGRTGVPLLVPADAAALPDSVLEAFEDSAFGLGARSAGDAPVLQRAPWLDRAVVTQLFGTAVQVVDISAASLPVRGRVRPAWLALTEGPGSAPAVTAIAADTASATGGALAFRLGDSLAYPTLYPLLSLNPSAARPGAPHVVTTGAGHGVATGSPWRRLLLAWSTQSRLPFGASRVDWELHPSGRLAEIAPFASWSSPRAAIVDARLVWLADGYVTSSAFPLVSAVTWRGGMARLLRAGFLGVVDAESGVVHIYQRPDGGLLAQAWAEIARAVVAPSGELPAALLRAAGPPAELTDVQTGLMVRRLRRVVSDLAVVGKDGTAERGVAWDTAGHPVAVYLLASPQTDRLFAVISAPAAGPPVLARLDSASLPSPAALERLWGRFATFAPVADSVAGAGAKLASGSVHLWHSPRGPAAFEVFTAARPDARPGIVWVALAVPGHLGAGRTFQSAWQNLLGNSIPAAPGAGSGRLDEARRWMRIADEALRSGDWSAFGRAFEALRGVLQEGP